MKKISYVNWRLVLVCSCLSSAVLSVAYKIISLQLEDSAFLQNEGKKRYIKYRTLNPVRGTIFDRNNFPLAVSVVNYDLYALKGLNTDKFLRIKANINSSSGFSILAIIQFFVLDLRSASLKSISDIGTEDVIIKNLLS